MSVPEKRKFFRYDVHTQVQFDHRGQHHRCETEDLGAGGCKIAVPWKLERGTVLEVTLGTSPDTARGQATVAWATHAEPFRVGLVFSDTLAGHAIDLIQRQLGSVRIHTEKA